MASRRIGKIVLTVATTAVTVAGATAGLVAPASAAPGVGVQLRVSVTPEANAAGTAAAGCNRQTRTEVCRDIDLNAQVMKNGQPIGSLSMRVTHTITFSTKSRSFREQITFRTTAVVGAAFGTSENLVVSCGSPCQATNGFPQGGALRVGETITGVVAYTDNVQPGQEHSTFSRYVLTLSKPGVTPGAATWKSMGYRCDDRLRPRAAGCVIPQTTAVMKEMGQLPQIAANIRRIQNGGPKHLGRPGSGHPLHRLMDRKMQEANRRAVCSPQVVGPPPRPGLSCDEYPFASTREGGTAVSRKDRGTAWVPVGEQNSQAGLITTALAAQRVLDGEAFFVSV